MTARLDRVRTKVARRHVWRTFRDWFRSGDRARAAVSSGATFSLSSDHLTSNHGLDAGLAFEEAGSIFDDGELLEFLEADADPAAADPEFRERLREELWGLVQDGVTALPKDH